MDLSCLSVKENPHICVRWAELMGMPHLDFVVEDESTKAFLDAWLERYLRGRATFKVQHYQGKKHLLGKLRSRLSGCCKWLSPSYRIIVIIDCDEEKCEDVKAEMEGKCSSVNVTTRRSGDSWQVATCIAIKELEAWYLGNWSAVRSAYSAKSTENEILKKYPDSDAVDGKTKDIVHGELTKHYPERFPSVEVAGAIGRHFDENKCRSPSFGHLRTVIDDVV